MKNWTLTPAVLLSLTAGLGIGQSVNANRSTDTTTIITADNQPSRSHNETGLTIAGSGYSLRQLGPIRSYDVEASIVLYHRHGPLPSQLRCWIGTRQDRQSAQLVQAQRHPQVVHLELPDVLRDTHVWLAIEQQNGDHGLCAYDLVT